MDKPKNTTNMAPSESLAHVRIATDGNWKVHPLEEHLKAVGQMAGQHAGSFGGTNWAQLAGLWHDIGKYREGFQRYIRQANDPDAHIEGRVGGRDKTHSAAGALWAAAELSERFGRQGEIVARVLAYVIAGHHAGLDNWYEGLSERLAGEDAQREVREALAAAPPENILRPDFSVPNLSALPIDHKTGIPGSFALWVRMLFSALVDADFLDTEAFMDGGKAAAREGYPSLVELVRRFDFYMDHKLAEVRARGQTESPVNRLRADVLRQCREKALRAPGVFTLTVPTGGGKTLSSLAFALSHATRHSKRRIVYAIPYTSIIEQTAEIFRAIFGDENIVEHHSNVDADPKAETHRSRLACENWDAPLIVTTNVQLFESLFARRTSRCRKLHNLVGSVVILDEAQLLPVEFLQPILDVLRLLVRDYGVTLLICTATQPALAEAESFDPARRIRGFKAGEVTEIIDDVPALYRALKRVHVHRPRDLDARREWPDIASEIARHEAVLAIVNRRADARELYGLLHAEQPAGLWHLSALMCAQHRSDVIAAIKAALIGRQAALARGSAVEPVRVISTQLVEAGVDMDFPVVFRAMAGLDSIAQAAGRCNREGRLEEAGDVHVFVPPTAAPPGFLRQAAQTCRVVWSRLGRHDDAFDVALFNDYFRRLYADGNLDAKDTCGALKVGREGDVRFRDAAEAFKLIDEQDGGTVLVRYRSPGAKEDISALIGLLEKDGPSRWLLRKLQRYGVTLYRRDLERLLREGDVRPVAGLSDLYVQVSDLLYDSELGVNVDGAPGDPALLVF
jgi:CRISPR-associated endonuclease/helicase Cas3